MKPLCITRCIDYACRGMYPLNHACLHMNFPLCFQMCCFVLFYNSWRRLMCTYMFGFWWKATFSSRQLAHCCPPRRKATWLDYALLLSWWASQSPRSTDLHVDLSHLHAGRPLLLALLRPIRSRQQVLIKWMHLQPWSTRRLLRILSWKQSKCLNRLADSSCWIFMIFYFHHATQQLEALGRHSGSVNKSLLSSEISFSWQCALSWFCFCKFSERVSTVSETWSAGFLWMADVWNEHTRSGKHARSRVYEFVCIYVLMYAWFQQVLCIIQASPLISEGSAIRDNDVINAWSPDCWSWGSRPNM